MGLIACQVVYEHGFDWLIELRKYLQSNLNFLKSFLKKNIPQIKVVEPEGTYLVWLDFNALRLSQEELDEFLLNNAKIYLSSGIDFGIQGIGFQRINIACPRSTLQCALEKLMIAIKQSEYWFEY